MQVRSVYKYARISPLKVRDVAREIQGMPVSAALETLQFTPRKSAVLIEKTLKSAIANAENNHDLMPDTLVVQSAVVGDGPTFRRFKPRARGSASPIQKRTSHITIIVTDDIELPEPKQKRGKAKSKPKAKAKAESKAESKPKAKPEPEAEAELEETTVTTGATADEPTTAAAAGEETAASADEPGAAGQAPDDTSEDTSKA